MKIIEALNEIKQNKVKVNDLRILIAKHSAHLDMATPEYPNTPEKIREWVQSCEDISKRNIDLLLAIQHTNLATNMTVKIGDKSITKPIAYWVWRKREYAKADYDTWSLLTDKGLVDQKIRVPGSATGEIKDIKLVRNFDPAKRDEALAEYKLEGDKAGAIDTALSIVTATTDLIGL
jgi:hypothetical protein